MKIKEVEEKLNISSYTLRYYEKMGLIKPFRDENGYRNYSDQDIKVLKKIRFLRELEIPIEDIQDIMEEKTTFQNVLDDHMKKIDTQMKSLQYVKGMCEDLKEREIPILEAMTDEKMINEEIINQENIKSGMKKIFDYFKDVKTVIIGCRVNTRDYLSFLPLSLIFSMLFGAMLGIGLPNLISYINQSFAHTPRKIYIPVFEPSFITFIIPATILFIVFSLGIAWYDSKQDYIELLDNYISICSYRYQNRLSILKSVLTKKDNPHNIHYQWNELDHVEIQLYFKAISGGRGLWTVYVPEFIFYFKDGFQYNIPSGLSFGEDTRTAYQILRSKNIEIIASDNIIDYFEQDKINGYDYFENIYHKNSKKC